MSTRLAMENYVVFGVTLAIITVSIQLLFLPFVFSEVDAIRDEFDAEIREALGVFESSYESLARIRPSSIRRQRDAVKTMIADNMSTGPADHRPHAASVKTHHVAPTPSKFSDELRKLARENPSPSSDYDMESEYEDAEPLTSSASDASDAEAETVGLSDTPPPPTLMEPGTPRKVGLPMCPLEENRCPPGLPGPPGTRGAPGDNGSDGNNGVAGSDAMDELTPSFPGYCITCPAGPDGKPGQPGPMGKPGLAGAPGIPGPNGKNGQPGAPGGYGSPGKQGQMGVRGHPGGQGQEGVVLLNTRGPKGPPGKPGPDGQTGEDGTNNNTPGPIGLPGLPGPPGTQGVPGTHGTRGEMGDAGTKGGDASCKCEELMKKAIETVENSAYMALEAQIPSKTEIRRTPQKASALAASGLPTLEQLREDFQKRQIVTSFAQEDGEVRKFAVAPSEVTVSEENSEGSHVLTSPEEPTPSEDVPQKPEESEFIDDDEAAEQQPVTRAALFAPPRAQLPRVMGDSHQKTSMLDGETVERTRSEGGRRRRVVKVKRVLRHPAFRVLSTSEDTVKFDEGEKALTIEKEIARESEKKVVSREVRRSPKRLHRKQKNEKVEKKLRRVHVTPSRELIHQHRQNSNILENIADSLGLIQKSSKPMNRVPIP